MPGQALLLPRLLVPIEGVVYVALLRLPALAEFQNKTVMPGGGSHVQETVASKTGDGCRCSGTDGGLRACNVGPTAELRSMPELSAQLQHEVLPTAFQILCRRPAADLRTVRLSQAGLLPRQRS
jgi:hypothetical protein